MTDLIGDIHGHADELKALRLGKESVTMNLYGFLKEIR